MAEDSTLATIKPLSHISSLWLIPLLTLLIGLGMVYQHWRSQGPLITIHFQQANGLEAGKTKVKYRDIEVGTVTALTLNANFEGVEATVRMNPNTNAMLGEQAKFWVVRPNIGVAGISGLDTILSGSYITLVADTNNSFSDKFTGLDAPPLTAPGTPGLHLTLNSDELFTFHAGSPISYRGFTVGQIEKIDFSPSGRTMYYEAFIRAPYHELITTNTRFWNASGVSLDVDATGAKIEAATLSSIISGGIAFGIPKDQDPGEQVTQPYFFRIYRDQDAINEKRYSHHIDFVVLLQDKSLGLLADAEILYRGIKIGRMVGEDFLSTTDDLLNPEQPIPILLRIEPARLGLPDSSEGEKQAAAEIRSLIKQGLKAKVSSSNFLLGSQLISLELNRDKPVQSVATFQNLDVIPLGENNFAALTEGLQTAVEKFNKLPLQDLANSGIGAINDIQNATEQLSRMLASGEDLLASTNQQKLPEQLQATLLKIEALSDSYAQGSAVNQQLVDLLASLNRRLKDISPVLAELNNQPNSLVFTGGGSSEQVPQKAKP